ncbi:hypothetical protein, partial [Streptococcus suis]|uniref:hypothetical protein n=1 Tax=Streptococcus suis TaxID=1307 RepID=UPI0004A44BEA
DHKIAHTLNTLSKILTDTAKSRAFREVVREEIMTNGTVNSTCRPAALLNCPKITSDNNDIRLFL